VEAMLSPISPLWVSEAKADGTWEWLRGRMGQARAWLRQPLTLSGPQTFQREQPSFVKSLSALPFWDC
jgi:hypothetical protein